MIERKLAPATEARQGSALDNLTADLLAARNEMVTSELFHQSGLAAGKVVLLLRHYQSGRRLRPRRLKKYLRLISGEAA